MFGGAEIWIVVIAILVLFGGSQIPKLAKSLGRAKRDFQDGLKDGETPSKDDEKDGNSEKKD